MKKDYLETVPNAERRFFTGTVETREVGKDGTQRRIAGYAAVFGKDSENFGGFVERIDPGAFADVMQNDVRALMNHDNNRVLGRNGTTMTLSVDNVGLRYEIDLPDTTVARDLYESIKRGDISQSSFGFIVKEEKWQDNRGDQKPSVRTITKVQRLFDVGPVTFPAYPDTAVASRSFEGLGKEERAASEDLAAMDETRMKLEMNKLKI